jgi:RimJ/RimL family protein N-acetyltransferase
LTCDCTRDWFDHTQEIWTKVGIFLKTPNNGTEGELIGEGGMHYPYDGGWPEICYILRKAYWGKGYAIEFVNRFLEVWWALPRVPKIIEDIITLEDPNFSKATERSCASINMENERSKKLMDKAGFVLYTTFLKDTSKRPPTPSLNAEWPYSTIERYRVWQQLKPSP